MLRGSRSSAHSDVRNILRFALGGLAFGLCVVGCSSEELAKPRTAYHPDDFAPANGIVYDPALVFQDSELEDDSDMSDESLRRYLRKTHYGVSSFLARYSSRCLDIDLAWCGAEEAIGKISKKFKISRRLLVAALQVRGQLLSAVDYPIPAARVEFIFGFGCDTLGGCDTSAAGLGHQVFELASRMRASLDRLRATGVSRTGKTLDRERAMTPAARNAATVVTYEEFPDGEEGRPGVWMLQAIYRKVR